MLHADESPGAHRSDAQDRPASHRTGFFRFLLADQHWEWSPEVEQMHGYGTGEVVPSTELVLSHEHPDDCGHLAATLEELVRTASPFSARHRIIDVRGEVREVIVVGDSVLDDDGEVMGTEGYYVDVTPSEHRVHQEAVTEAVTEITENRGGIDQAKGMLMLVYHIDAEAAFDLLKWRSQASNVKLRAIGQQIVADFLTLTYSDVLPPRSSYDRLLLTAHERIKDDAERGTGSD
ncbi:PAS and ANTAR domain-containing protein [Mycolicibacterium hodleri]|uniref:ANTAR domain-containing protein n=1 Tax=Mycolicibacterium hodleri TaxID=49897 RepID=A0A502DUN9_9MYCO|nr:PAS and ANTAR domain-containing protein [Mycolicibacterium hodleri]TPG28269.1 ANTAR domain-containing protein [Mycolicibacterium hodleri]